MRHALVLFLVAASGGASAPSGLTAVAGCEEIVKKVLAESFRETKDNHIAQELKLRTGEELTIVLPRLFGGHVWKRRIRDGREACLPFVRDDQFYDGGDIRPGDVSYVAYTFKAVEPGRLKLEFRLLRPRETFEKDGPSYLVDLEIVER